VLRYCTIAVGDSCSSYDRNFSLLCLRELRTTHTYPTSTFLCQVTISVPGSAALQGERLSAKIRIDDNDYDRGAEFC
jgi:hypothetical protein